MQLGGYIQALAHGLDVVEQCAGVTRAQLVQMGARPDFAEKLLNLHALYFGDTIFRSRQRTARRTGHDVFTLLEIERYCSNLKSPQGLGAAPTAGRYPAGENSRGGEGQA